MGVPPPPGGPGGGSVIACKNDVSDDWFNEDAMPAEAFCACTLSIARLTSGLE